MYTVREPQDREHDAADLDPLREAPALEAARSGEEAAVCGHCVLRGTSGLTSRICYVTLGRAPTNVWHAWKARRYIALHDIGWSWVRHRSIRFGAYGDPAAAPASLWFTLAAQARLWTGYTHEWRREETQQLRRILMASVESPSDAWFARSLGWRTYRIRLASEPLLPFESVCPGSPEGNWKATCATCLQCDGVAPYDLRRSYSIVIHGSGAAAFRRAKLRII